jgi:UDP-N-acetylmuramate--alanine ligase
MPRSAHLIGIGGAGMRSLAKALHARGVAVSGTDLSSMEKLADLSRLGMRVHDSHASEFLGDPEVVVYSTAIPTSNPEFAEAKSRGIRIMHRAEMLAEFLREHRSILIAGTHGKTTTTTLTALLMEAGGLDPWAFVGGEVKEFEGNVRCGGMEWCVAEADESDGSFLLLPGQHGIITNIESEHLSYWESDENLFKGFLEFAGRFEPKKLVVCANDEGIRTLLAEGRVNATTYGTVGSGSDFEYGEVDLSGSGSEFLLFHRGLPMMRVSIGIPGMHNVANAAGALALAHTVGVDIARAAKALANFRGVGRRFTKYPLKNEILLIDDYAHHATEVRATISAARLLAAERGGRLLAIFQPHRHSRTWHYRDLYAEALSGADEIILTEIYSAGEEPIGEFSGQVLAELVAESNSDRTHFASLPGEAIQRALDLAHSRDIILVLGAGSITDEAKKLYNRMGG